MHFDVGFDCSSCRRSCLGAARVHDGSFEDERPTLAADNVDGETLKSPDLACQQCSSVIVESLELHSVLAKEEALELLQKWQSTA